MQFTIFAIPYFGDKTKENELNAFLRSKKVVTVSKELVTVANEAYWSFCVRWLLGEPSTKPQKVDYTKGLTQAEFIKYEQLKVIRKQLAQTMGIPAYAVFTNKELCEVAKLTEITKKTLLTVEGIGQGKLQKVGEDFLKLYKNEKN